MREKTLHKSDKTTISLSLNVIHDNAIDNTSQPIAALESRLTAQSANWSWAEDIVLLVKRDRDLTGS